MDFEYHFCKTVFTFFLCFDSVVADYQGSGLLMLKTGGVCWLVESWGALVAMVVSFYLLLVASASWVRWVQCVWALWSGLFDLLRGLKGDDKWLKKGRWRSEMPLSVGAGVKLVSKLSWSPDQCRARVCLCSSGGTVTLMECFLTHTGVTFLLLINSLNVNDSNILEV